MMFSESWLKFLGSKTTTLTIPYFETLGTNGRLRKELKTFQRQRSRDPIAGGGALSRQSVQLRWLAVFDNTIVVTLRPLWDVMGCQVATCL